MFKRESVWTQWKKKKEMFLILIWRKFEYKEQHVIYFDIDGVVRDLCTAMWGITPVIWEHKDKDGRGVCDIINSNLPLLENAPPTEYVPYISTLDHLFFISWQDKQWEPYTINWLNKWIGCSRFDVRFVKNTHEKLDMLKEGDILVEDYPNYADYSKIILIDQPYNQKVSCNRRVKSPKELAIFLDRTKTFDGK
jgi:hypothetical protein